MGKLKQKVKNKFIRNFFFHLVGYLKINENSQIFCDKES